MENQVRIYKRNRQVYFNMAILKYLRRKYGKDKKLFVALRSVFMALNEIAEDFIDTPVTFFTKTVGTYAGVSREVAGRYINLLQTEKLIVKTRIKDTKTGKFSMGTTIELLDVVPDNEPLPGYASNGLTQRRDNRAALYNKYKNANTKIKNNVISKTPLKSEIETAEQQAKTTHYAQLIAEKLGDQKSITFYKIACQKYDPEKLLKKAHAIVADGGADNPGAVFVTWLKAQKRMEATQ
jgi:hypothetical protein